MPIPAAIASPGPLNATGLIVDQDLAGIGLVQPVQDVHEGGLAGAVLAEQAESLAVAHLETYVVIGEHTWEALGYAAKFELQPLPIPR